MFSYTQAIVFRKVLWLIVLLTLFAGHAFSQQQRVAKSRHDKVKTFESFLEKNPSVAVDLDKDPSLVDDQKYLAEHPELQQMIKANPAIREEILSKGQRCELGIPSIFDRVSPSVVYIFATSINPYRTTDRVERVVGSGFIIDPSGLILTNSHVAFGRQSVFVRLSDGTSVPAEMIGADPIFDVALLRIPKPSEGSLPALALADSDRVHVGGEAIAIGNPLGLDQTLTRGIVSATNRVLPITFFSSEEPLIQIDTPINPGNSGGPLINQCGEVIGITTAIIPNAQNIGFAIPVNLVKALLPSLISQGHVVRPWLGFHGQLIDDTLQKIFRFPLVSGFMVEVVEPGSPADKAGLRGGQLEVSIAGDDFLMGGDIIIKINGAAVTEPEKLIESLRGIKVGSNISLTVVRNGEQLDINYSVPERPLLPGDVAGPNASFTPALVSPLRQQGRSPKAASGFHF
jgi:serine protease Do